MAVKSVSEEMGEGVRAAREPVVVSELVKFVLQVIALFGFMYCVHVLIHLW